MNRLCKYLILTTVFIALGASAALPPVRGNDREWMASHIVIGKVTEISSKIISTGEDHADAHYKVTLQIEESCKGGKKVGEIIEFSFWRAFKRPRGMCGDTGQSSVPTVGGSIKAYLQEGTDGTNEPIYPNGFDGR